jgi:hypothetical protein
VGVIIIVVYIVADLVARVVRIAVERLGEPIKITDFGVALRVAGLDSLNLIVSIVNALIMVIAMVVGFGMIIATGIAADILSAAVFYLPRILGVIVILLLALPLVLMLSRFIDETFEAVLVVKFEPIVGLIENLIKA